MIGGERTISELATDHQLHVLADVMQRGLAASAGLILDIDDHLDARQMVRQRSAVHPALRNGSSALGRCRFLALGFIRGDDLAGLVQGEQQLNFRQRLRPAAEAVALQLLDDLAQTINLMTLGDEDRPTRNQRY